MRSALETRASRARWGVALLFFVNAVAFASIVPRYVEFRATFDLDNSALGLIIAAGPVGSLVAGLVAGRILRAIGSAPTAVTSSVLLGFNLVLISLATDGVQLAVALFIAGVLDSTGDIANNAHGLRVQRLMGRSVISGLHGVWSIGAIAGGLVAALAISTAVPIATQLVATGIAIALLSGVAGYLVRLPAPSTKAEADAAPHTLSPARRLAVGPFLAVLGIAIIGALLEDMVSTWGGIYLVDIVGTAKEAAGLVFIVFMCALTIGRLAGDGAIMRWGTRRVLDGGACLAAAGFLLALASPALWSTLAGFALVGVGIATMIPSAMQAADETPGLRIGSGLAIASVAMRVGFLAPPVVGAIADATSLRWALLIAPAAALSVIALTRMSSVSDRVVVSA